jgi:hypothetical protein
MDTQKKQPQTVYQTRKSGLKKLALCLPFVVLYQTSNSSSLETRKATNSEMQRKWRVTHKAVFNNQMNPVPHGSLAFYTEAIVEIVPP